MTGRKAQALMGKRFIYHVPKTGLQVEVKIDDWKTAYARDLFLIIPVAGSGSTWVTLDSLHAKEA